MEKKKIQQYINNFRRKISPYLKKNMALKAIVYPYLKGAIVVFEFGGGTQTRDEYRTESKNIGEALKRAKINAFGEIVSDNIKFEGTNTVMFDNNIALIKDLNDNEWTDKQAAIDVNKILSPKKRN
ncbi:hypothetical protein [Mariniflexile sp. AS56]|uniref:hypothetical protein n=1 Tax=Mariniflexile sp. AS56 TaxID=3063957 RepID=UPI00398AD315